MATLRRFLLSPVYWLRCRATVSGPACVLHHAALFYGPSGGVLNTVLSASGISTLITSDQPVVVERVEYCGSPNAHDVAGSDVFGLNGAGRRWSFPGGASAGDNEYLLLYNAAVLPLTVEATFYDSDGHTASHWVHVPPVGRAILDVQALVPGFAPTHGVILQSTSGQGFIAEQTVFTPTYRTPHSTEGQAQ